MVATTGGFFVPSLRFATASVLCDGELDQRLPVSNKRLNLYCNPADGDEPYAVGFMPYLDARGLRRRLPHRENSAACAGPAGRRRRIGSCPSTGRASRSHRARLGDLRRGGRLTGGLPRRRMELARPKSKSDGRPPAGRSGEPVRTPDRASRRSCSLLADLEQADRVFPPRRAAGQAASDDVITYAAASEWIEDLEASSTSGDFSCRSRSSPSWRRSISKLRIVRIDSPSPWRPASWSAQSWGSDCATSLDAALTLVSETNPRACRRPIVSDLEHDGHADILRERIDGLTGD